MAKDHKISQDFFVVSFLSFLSFQSLRLNRKGIPTVAFWGLPLQPHREFVETLERRNLVLCSRSYCVLLCPLLVCWVEFRWCPLLPRSNVEALTMPNTSHLVWVRFFQNVTYCHLAVSWITVFNCLSCRLDFHPWVLTVCMGYADSADCADVDFCGSSAGVATDFRSNARRGGPSPQS